MKQVFSNAELQSPAAGFGREVPMAGMQGFRIWNLTGTYWGLFRRGAAEADEWVPPFTHVEGTFEEVGDSVEPVLIAALDVPNQTVATIPAANYMFGYQFVRKARARLFVPLAPGY